METNVGTVNSFKEKIFSKKILIVGIISVIILAIIGGYFWFSDKTIEEKISGKEDKPLEDLSDLTSDHLDEALQELNAIDFSLRE